MTLIFEILLGVGFGFCMFMTGFLINNKKNKNAPADKTIKLYTLWHGEYSDRKLLGIFYTMGDAIIHTIALKHFIDEDQIDIKEYVLNSIQQFEYVYVYFDKNLNYIPETSYSISDSSEYFNDPVVEVVYTGGYRVVAQYSTDEKCVIKRAKDKLISYIAMQEGI